MSDTEARENDRQALRATMPRLRPGNQREGLGHAPQLPGSGRDDHDDRPDDAARAGRSRPLHREQQGTFSSILSDLQVDPVPDGPAVFHGDIAIATLSSADRFIFRTGKELLVQNRYTATLRK